MNCKECGKAYTPVNCPACGGVLGDGICPECLGEVPLVCANCGKTVELRRRAPEGQAQMEAGPGYKPYTPPEKKMKLGGWLLAFVIYYCGLLLYNVGSLIYTTASGAMSSATAALPGTAGVVTAVFSMLLSIGISVVPVLIMLYYIHERSEKFKSVVTVVMILSIVMLVFAVIGGAFSMVAMPMMNDPMVQAQLEAQGVAAEMPSTLSILGGMLATVVTSGIDIAFFIYTRRSKRVAQTFDPLNNPPKQ